MDEVESVKDVIDSLYMAKSKMQISLCYVNERLDTLNHFKPQETLQNRFRLISRQLAHMKEIQRIELAECSSSDDDLNADISACSMDDLREFFAKECCDEYASSTVQLESQEVRNGAEGNIVTLPRNASQDKQSAVEDHIQKPKKRRRRKRKSLSAVQNVGQHNGKDLKSGSEISKHKHAKTNQEEFNADDDDQNECFAFEENIKQKRQENENQVESNADES